MDCSSTFQLLPTEPVFHVASCHWLVNNSTFPRVELSLVSQQFNGFSRTWFIGDSWSSSFMNNGSFHVADYRWLVNNSALHVVDCYWLVNNSMVLVDYEVLTDYGLINFAPMVCCSMLRNCFGCSTPDDAAAAELGTYRDVLPTHFTFKVQSFSLLTTFYSMVKLESNEFEAGGYKWRLVFYPKGNNKTTSTQNSSSSSGSSHYVSMYLKIVDTDSLPRGWVLDVSFRFFLLDQVRDKYLIIGDTGGRTRRFHEMKTMWGYSQLLPLTTLNDSSNGFLVDDAFVFGAEVFPCKHTGCGDCLTMVKSPLCVKYTWKIKNFSKTRKKCIYSNEFNAGEHKWKIQIFPKGDFRADNENLSLFLRNLDTEVAGEQVYARYKLRVRDQFHNLHKEMQVGVANWFTSSRKGWGSPKFMRLDQINDQSKGYLVNDTIIVEAEVTVLGALKKLS